MTRDDDASSDLRVFRESKTASMHDAMTQSGEPQIIISTLYNEIAYQHIRGHNLYQREQLERLLADGPVDSSVPGHRMVPPFPSDAMVLLTGWWPVARDQVTGLPVWDPELNPPRKRGNNYMTWRRVVAIDPSVGTALRATGPIEFAGQPLLDVRRVAPEAFGHILVDERMAQRVRQDSLAHKAAVIALGRGLEVGDYLVLVAMHITAKELDDWIWVTLWWHDRPNEGAFAQDRPRDLRAPWHNYLLDVALDAEFPVGSDGNPHTCFNPWLEARFPDGGLGGGTVSNCVACHHRASYPAVNFLPVTRGAPDVANDAAYAPGRLRTDFMWSIARLAGPTSAQQKSRLPTDSPPAE